MWSLDQLALGNEFICELTVTLEEWWLENPLPAEAEEFRKEVNERHYRSPTIPGNASTLFKKFLL